MSHGKSVRTYKHTHIDTHIHTHTFSQILSILWEKQKSHFMSTPRKTVGQTPTFSPFRRKFKLGGCNPPVDTPGVSTHPKSVAGQTPVFSPFRRKAKLEPRTGQAEHGREYITPSLKRPDKVKDTRHPSEIVGDQSPEPTKKLRYDTPDVSKSPEDTPCLKRKEKTKVHENKHVCSKTNRANMKVQQFFIKKDILKAKVEGSKTHEGRLLDGRTNKLKKGDTIMYFCNPITRWRLTTEPCVHENIQVGIKEIGFTQLMPWLTTEDECLIEYVKLFTKRTNINLMQAKWWDNNERDKLFVTWSDEIINVDVDLLKKLGLHG